MILKTTFQAKELKKSLKMDESNNQKMEIIESENEVLKEENYEDNLRNLKKELEYNMKNTVEGSGRK